MPPVSRVLEVLLRLSGQQEYQQGLAAADAATDEFASGAEEASASIADQFESIAAALLPVSAAISGLGAAAVAVALPYDRAFTQIETLVGVAADEVDRMRVATLDLAGDTARAPAELAEAMFTIQSAGLRGAAGTEALEVAARQAALGMGETRANAQNLTSALNAYRGSNLTAAEAGDILTATVRAGNFEASQLAGSLGRILPNAVAAGVSFEDVGGAIALFTRTSGDANIALTQLDGLMRAFIRPTQQAQEIVAEAGLSFDDLRATIEQDGLVAAVQQLDAALGGNRNQLARVIEDSTGLTAAFQILDADTATLEATFGAVGNSTGLLGEAFGQLSESDSFRFDQAMNDLRVSLTQLGAEVLPAVASALQIAIAPVRSLGEAFAGLPSEAQTAIVALGGVLAVSGPLFAALARLAPAVSAIGSVMTTTSLSIVGGQAALAGAGAMSIETATRFTRLGGALLGLGAAATAGAILFEQWSENQQEAADRAEALAGALGGSLNPAINDAIALLQQVNDTAEDTAQQGIDGLVDSFGNTRVEAGLLVDELEADGLVDAFNRLGLSLENDVVPAVRTGTDAFESMQIALQRGIGVDDVRQQLDGLDPAVRQVAESILDMVDARTISRDQAIGILDVLDEQADAYDDVAEQVEETARQELERAVALGNLTREQVDNALATAAAEGATHLYAAAAAELRPEIEGIERAQRFGNLALGDGAAVMTDFYIPALGLTDDALRTVHGNTESLVDIVGTHVDQLLAAELANRNLASSYDAVNQAASPYRELLEATVDPLIRQQIAQDEATLAIQAMIDTVGADGSVLRGALEGGFDASGAAAAEARIEFTELGGRLQSIVVDYAAAGASAEDVANLQAFLVDELTRVGVQMGLTEEEARQYAESLVLIPDEVITLLVADVAEAQEGVDNLIAQALAYGELDPTALLQADAADARATVAATVLEMEGYSFLRFISELDADNDPADRALAAALLGLAGFDGEEATALLDGDPLLLFAALVAAGRELDLFDGTTATGFIDFEIRANQNLVDFDPAPGGNLVRAHGGIVDYYAAGGMREQHLAEIAPAGAWRVWAEPETQGEAYIPLANDWRRERAKSVWAETGRRIGTIGPEGDVTMAHGGILHGSPIARAYPIGGIISAMFNNDGIVIDANIQIDIADTLGGPDGGGFGQVVNVNAGAISVVVEGGGVADEAAIRREIEAAFCEVLGEARSGGARPPTARIR